jgi:uncharacterized repeat protein (TIGR04042 family)
MPEMRFRIRWPDGKVETCYSPSLVVKDYLTPGESYPLADFVVRSRTALVIASKRVEEKYGSACSRAAAQLSRIENAAASFAGLPNARVRVDAFDE